MPPLGRLHSAGRLRRPAAGSWSAAANSSSLEGNWQPARLRNLPLKGYAQNQVWCEIVALACELLAWTQMLALPGKARRWEPRRLRLRVFAVAGRLARSGRRLRLRLAERWPWAGQVTVAATRLQALPSG